MQETGAVAPQTARAEKFDARAFVFACLEECPDLKLAEIEQLALARNQELSQSTASRYRKQFFARCESSTMQGASTNESSTMQMQGDDESSAMQAASTNASAPIDEQKVVGE